MQQNKLILIFIALVFMFIGLRPELALACKTYIYPESFPIDELKNYDHVYVVRVGKINLSRPLEESWYFPPFNFEGEVIQSLKGLKKPGDIIKAVTTSEDAHARCPIGLEVGKFYLLMFRGNEMPYQLPRYDSLFTSSEQPEFNKYVSDINQATKMKSKD